MDIQAYLNRIGYQGHLFPDLALLQELQKSHLYKIPFENLDIHYGRKIYLDKEKIFYKIMHEGRGGFCYELNGLFYFLLKELGFKVKRISARVYGSDKKFGQEYDHLAILCQVNEAHYLVDVGYGEFALYPLLFKLGKELSDPRGTFKFESFQENSYLVSKKTEGDWVPEYLFNLKERTYEEFAEMCVYHQESEASPFTQKRLCTLPTPNGRISLLNDRLKIREGAHTTEHQISNETDAFRHLKKYFGITTDLNQKNFQINPDQIKQLSYIIAYQSKAKQYG